MQSLDQKHFTNSDAQSASLRGGMVGADRFLLSAIPHMCDDDGDQGETPSISGRRSHQFIRNVSLHEAGHAVVSRLLALPVCGSTINFIDGFHGCTWASDTAMLPDSETVNDLVDALTPLMPRAGEDRSCIATELQRATDQVLALLAGPIAETLFTAGRVAGSEHDEEEAAAIALLVCRSPRSVDAYLGFCRAEAIALLTDHRNIVLAIADALTEHRTIYAEQIDAIIAAASLRTSHG